MIVSLILFSQVFTALTASYHHQTRQIKNLKIKISNRNKSSDTKPNDEDDIGKQEEDSEEQESNDDTRERESQDNVMIDDDEDINSSEDDDVPFELPFDNTIPFP